MHGGCALSGSPCVPLTVFPARTEDPPQQPCEEGADKLTPLPDEESEPYTHEATSVSLLMRGRAQASGSSIVPRLLSPYLEAAPRQRSADNPQDLGAPGPPVLPLWLPGSTAHVCTCQRVCVSG